MDSLTHAEVKSFINSNSLKVPFKVKLSTPIEFGEGKCFEEVDVYREPTAGDYELMPTEKQTFGDHYRPISKMIGQPIAFVNRLTGKDAKILMEISTHFFVGSGTL